MSETGQQDGPTPPATAAVWAAILGVMERVTVIGKNRQMPESARVGEYKYRANEDVQDAVSGAFREHTLMTQSRDITLTQTQTNVAGARGTTVWTSVFVTLTYRFTSLIDGSWVEFAVAGEGRDNSDKATNKAMTAAHKTALLQAFELAFTVTDPDSERPVIHQEDQYRPEPPAKSDKRTDAQRQAEEAYAARRRANTAPAGDNVPDEVQRGEEGQDDRAMAQSRPVQGDPLAEATAAIEREMNATPVESTGATNDPAEIDTRATAALARAHRDSTQGDSGAPRQARTVEESQRLADAYRAGSAATSRHTVNRIILAASGESLLCMRIEGQPLAQHLSAMRNTVAR
jgi:hypothetical protein